MEAAEKTSPACGTAGDMGKRWRRNFSADGRKLALLKNLRISNISGSL
jgi:hypothetical protein